MRGYRAEPRELAIAAISAELLADEPFGLRAAAGCLLILSAGALEGAAELRRQVASLLLYAPASVSDISRRAE